MAQGIDRLRENMHKISATFVGIAGGASSGAGTQIICLLRERYGGCAADCDSDMVNVLGFAPDPLNAIGMICGTGSNVFVRQNKEMCYTGGWGYLFDDGGSGFDIGRDAMREALAVCDGLKPERSLSKRITKEIGDAKKSLGNFYKMNVHGRVKRKCSAWNDGVFTKVSHIKEIRKTMCRNAFVF